jgi:GTPase SAR1 family protein
VPESCRYKWDVFISHSSEDKEGFVRELAEELQRRGLRVWYDEHTLVLGDNLRRKIDEGLAQSAYGIVVLSHSFFARDWPQNELDGLVAREVNEKKVILPIWHGVTRIDVIRYSPILASRLAVSSSKGVVSVVDEIISATTLPDEPLPNTSAEQFLDHEDLPHSQSDYPNARAEYVRVMRNRCFNFERFFRGSPMNRLTKQSFIPQVLGEEIKALDELTPTQTVTKEVIRDLEEALELHRRIAVVGPAGRGKTSLLYWVVQTRLAALQDGGAFRIPLYLALRELNRFGGDLESFLQHEFSDDVREWIHHKLRSGRVVLLLDGLDEVPRNNRQEFASVGGAISGLVRTLRTTEAQIVLTCREPIYNELDEQLAELKYSGDAEGFVKMELKQFDRSQIARYVRQFFRDERESHLFLKSIEEPHERELKDEEEQRYVHLAAEPLYLHMLCWLSAGIGVDSRPARFRLQATEDDLWKELIKRLLRQRDVHQKDAGDHLRVLEELAFHKVFCGKDITYGFAEDTATWLAHDQNFASPRDKAQQWLSDLENWGLLLDSSGEHFDYSFPISTLDEYLTARHIAGRWKGWHQQYGCLIPCHKASWQFESTFVPSSRKKFESGSEIVSYGPKEGPYCPNPHCNTKWNYDTRSWYHNSDYEEVFLLMVGVLQDESLEEDLLEYLHPGNFGYRFMWAIATGLNYFLKALSRCRYVHLKQIKWFTDFPLAGKNYCVYEIKDGLQFMRHARTVDNLKQMAEMYICKLNEAKWGGYGRFVIEWINYSKVLPYIELGDPVQPIYFTDTTS